MSLREYEQEVPESFSNGDWGFDSGTSDIDDGEDEVLYEPDEPRVALPEQIRVLVDRAKVVDLDNKTLAQPLYDEFQGIIDKQHQANLTEGISHPAPSRGRPFPLHKHTHTTHTHTGVKPVFSITTSYETHAYVNIKAPLKHTFEVGTLPLVRRTTPPCSF